MVICELVTHHSGDRVTFNHLVQLYPDVKRSIHNVDKLQSQHFSRRREEHAHTAVDSEVRQKAAVSYFEVRV